MRALVRPAVFGALLSLAGLSVPDWRACRGRLQRSIARVDFEMWIPDTEQEIMAVVTSGTLEETSIFDAKREVSAKSPEIAKDVAAMANDGGVIIYGIDEDEHGRPAVLSPVLLAGQRERIASIVQTAIAEPPAVTISTIPTAADPSHGYIVVMVPPSERAPHMVVVKGENRYYGRGAAGNVPLTEGEVARLYERRRQWDVDRNLLLQSEIDQAPLQPRPGFAYLHIIVRPVIGDDSLAGKALRSGQTVQGVLHELVDQISQPQVYPRSYDPDWYAPNRWVRRVEGFFTWLHDPGDLNQPDAPGHALSLQIDFNGTGHLFCGRAAEQAEKSFFFFPPIVAGNAVRLLALLGQLYSRARYIGQVDAGVAIIGLRGSVPYTRNLFPRHFATVYDRDEYRKTGRFSAALLRDDLISVARQLLMPLFDAMSQGHLDPFVRNEQA